MANPNERNPQQGSDKTNRTDDPTGERGTRQQDQSGLNRDRNAQQGGQSGQGQPPRDPQRRDPQR